LRAEGEKTMKEDAETQLFRLDPKQLHRLPLVTLHKDHIGKIVYIPTLKRYLTVGRDGIICYYSEQLKFIRQFRQEESKIEKRKQGNWVHDALFYPVFNKIITAADDNCIAYLTFKINPLGSTIIQQPSAMSV
jgi:hypothetical protein